MVGPTVAAVALAARRWRLAVGALAATALNFVLERVVKVLVDRQRPAKSIGVEAVLRGDVHTSGRSFVSGHAVLSAALAVLVVPYVPRRWRAVPVTLVVLVCVTRVYVGAHNPLDVVCGAALGVTIGAALNLVLGVPVGEARLEPDPVLPAE